MPAPRWVARANKIGLNRFTKYIAPWAPDGQSSSIADVNRGAPSAPRCGLSAATADL